MSIMLDSTLKKSDLYLLHEIVHDASIGRIPNKQNLQKREKGLKLHQLSRVKSPPPPPPPPPSTSEHLGKELIHGTAKSNFLNKTVDFVGDTSRSVYTTTSDNF